MASRTRIPLHIKILLPTLTAAGAALGWCFPLLDGTLKQEQAYRAGETNATVLHSLASEVNALFKLRFSELEALVPQIYRDPGAFRSLPTHLRQELVQITFYQPRPPFKPKAFVNQELLRAQGWPAGLLTSLERQRPLDLPSLENQQDLRVFNRSLRLENGDPLPVFSLVLFGRPVDGDPHQVIIVADLVGNFLVQALSPSPLADLFLVNQDGTLFANSSPGEMADFANAVWSQPVTQALSETSHPGQSFRWKFDKQAYIGGIAPTPIPGVFAVSQIAEADGLDILSELRQRSALAVIACACLCAFFNIWMASRTGRRLRRLAQRLDRLSAGDFSEVSKVNSWDETAEVSTAVERIAKEMPIQIEAAASNARAQSERALAVNLRAVLGADPKVNLPAIDICPHRPGDNIEAVDFWDCYADGPYLTFILGRTNSDGVGAGLFAAYAKSTLIAKRLIELRGGQKTSLVHQLQTLNDSLHLTYQGSHALEACAIRLHTETGICEVVNCGSETPFFLAGEVTSNTPMAGPTGAQIRETTQPRGSALGAQSGAVFQASQLQLKHGEFIFLFTHTLWRAPSLVERTQSRGRVGEHLLNSFHLTPQATSAHFLNKSPFGDEITFWLVEWRPLRVSIPDQKAG